METLIVENYKSEIIQSPGFIKGGLSRQDKVELPDNRVRSLLVYINI